MEPSFVTVGDVLTPNRFYARIYCADGNVLYTSQVVDVPGGPSERRLTFTCTPCEGAPVVPAWSLDQSYPNPATDSLTVPFSLQVMAQALITLHWPNGRMTETLTDSLYGSGGRRLHFALLDRANGLYTIRYVSGTFQTTRTFLKNVTDYDALRVTDETDLSETDGGFQFDAAAGEPIALRGADNADQGTVTLSRLTVVAIKSGYQIADTTFDVAGQQEYQLNLTLRAK
jgi:hypothetical protein